MPSFPSALYSQCSMTAKKPGDSKRQDWANVCWDGWRTIPFPFKSIFADIYRQRRLQKAFRAIEINISPSPVGMQIGKLPNNIQNKLTDKPPHNCLKTLIQFLPTERRINITRYTLKMQKAQLHPVHRKTKVQFIMETFSQNSGRDTRPKKTPKNQHTHPSPKPSISIVVP